MSKEEITNVFNCMIRGTPVSFTEKILPLISEYLTEINCKNTKEIIYLITQHPELAEHTFVKIIDYFTRKYQINSLMYNGNVLCYL